VSRRYCKSIFILILISLCASCGNSRVDYPECIKPTVLKSIADGDFVFQDPVSAWSDFLAVINPKWSDARVCIEEAYSSNIGVSHGLNCYDSHQTRFNATALPENTKLILDGFVRVEEPWGIPRFFTGDISVYYRGKVNSDYFWISIIPLRLLTSKMKSGRAVPILESNRNSLEYLELDSKLRTRNRSEIWPCDPQLVNPRKE